MQNLYLYTVLAPLIGAILAGLFGKTIGRAGAHWVTILGVATAFILSLVACKHHIIDGAAAYNGTVYTWLVTDGVRFEIGFLVDRLTVLMMTVVTFVSLMVHIYTIGYMRDDPGYQRFFSYIALFTFAMLMLVMANNFLQLFFGWEAVGVVSYLLIGFWFQRESAIFANMKAFLVNRVGDFGFLLGIAAVYHYFGSLDYAEVFAAAPTTLAQAEPMQILPGQLWPVATFICICLFIGAMGKSAQFPLHVWLPDSMEGPTPISALIHAATMVTAGIFMVARMSPLFELSETALSFVLIIGALTAFFMGLVGIVQNDIKRVVAYSTLSQLGYMVVALGSSAYAAAIFHLMTHAFFKALLFLAAGSVIIAMHHDQDIRNMGGLRKYMPITYATVLLGTLALVGFPGFSGFFSKDYIILSVEASQRAGAGFAYIMVLLGVFVTALYSFRMFYLVFHGQERMDEKTRSHLHETPAVVTIPLVLLAIPSVFIGYFTVGPVLFGDYFGTALFVLPENDVLAQLGAHYHGAWGVIKHGLLSLPSLLMALGWLTAWYVYRRHPSYAATCQRNCSWIHRVLEKKYGFDELNQWLFAGGSRLLGRVLWRVGDATLIDGVMVNGSAHSVGWFSSLLRRVQTGYLYHYAFAMIIGLLALLTWFVIV